MFRNICIYPNMRILGEVRIKEYKNGENRFKRASFAVSPMTPESNGIFMKLFCYAFDKQAEELEKMDLKENDIVTLFLEHGIYRTDAGVIEDRYSVKSCNMVRRNAERKKQAVSTEKSSSLPPAEKGNLYDFVTFMETEFK